MKAEVQASEKESMDVMGNPEENLYWPRVRLQVSEDKFFHTKAAMCRTHRHKYVKRLYETDELYDLKNDPQELTNIINHPSSKEVLSVLKEKMADWYMETCDVVPMKMDKRW